MRLAATGPDSEVRVSNSVVASRRALLTGEIKRLGTMSAAEAYVDALHRTKKRSQGSCGLGLSRIRCEASTELTLVTESDNFVTVVAASTH